MKGPETLQSQPEDDSAAKNKRAPKATAAALAGMIAMAAPASDAKADMFTDMVGGAAQELSGMTDRATKERENMLRRGIEDVANGRKFTVEPRNVESVTVPGGEEIGAENESVLFERAKKKAPSFVEQLHERVSEQMISAERLEGRAAYAAKQAIDTSVQIAINHFVSEIQEGIPNTQGKLTFLAQEAAALYLNEVLIHLNLDTYDPIKKYVKVLLDRTSDESKEIRDSFER